MLVLIIRFQRVSDSICGMRMDMFLPSQSSHYSCHYMCAYGKGKINYAHAAGIYVVEAWSFSLVMSFEVR